jgi:hypothetical protein
MALPTVTVTDADVYFSSTPRDGAWQATTDKDIWVDEATTWLAALCWDDKATCCGNDFNDAYIRAVSELALALSLNPTALIGGGVASTGTTGAVKRQKLGDLEVEYFPVGSGGSSSTPGTTKGPLVLRTFPWLRDIIGCWVLNSGANQLAYRVRS